jgi:hypothetical protein
VDCFVNGLRDEDVLVMPEPVYFGGTVDRSVGSQEIICEIERHGRKAPAFPDRSACGDALVKLARRGDRMVVMGACDDSLSQFAHELLSTDCAVERVDCTGDRQLTSGTGRPQPHGARMTVIQCAAASAQSHKISYKFPACTCAAAFRLENVGSQLRSLHQSSPNVLPPPLFL